jgi:hypothetical protein
MKLFGNGFSLLSYVALFFLFNETIRFINSPLKKKMSGSYQSMGSKMRRFGKGKFTTPKRNKTRRISNIGYLKQKTNSMV